MENSMTNQKELKISIGNVISIISMLLVVFGSYISTSQRITKLETQVQSLEKYNDTMAPVIVRLDKSVLKLSMVLDNRSVKDGTVVKGKQPIHWGGLE